MSELLPCPFCGGKAADGHIRYTRPLVDTAWIDGTPVTEAFYVNCIECCAVSHGGFVCGAQTQKEARAAWNRRTTTGDTSQ